ncbi:MAG: helix-turn-helix transcriptional regulator, partial [Sphingomonadaceae bacterium]
IVHARFVRISAAENINAWILASHRRIEFEAADSALLSNLVPHIASAMMQFARIENLRMKLAMAESALSRIGVSQCALDKNGSVVVTGDDTNSHLSLTDGERLHIPASLQQILTQFCAQSDDANDEADTLPLLLQDKPEQPPVLVRRVLADSTLLPNGVCAIALCRDDTDRQAGKSGAIIAQALYGISSREAALAEAICLGDSIVEGGRKIGLTPETARNYSKRIYAKTGAKGQADLVRKLLGSVFPFG